MKKITLPMFMLMAALFVVSCSDNDDKNSDPTPKGRETFYVGEGGTPVPNPVNSEFCKQDKAKETLESIRHIAGLVYRMDYLSPCMMANSWKQTFAAVAKEIHSSMNGISPQEEEKELWII